MFQEEADVNWGSVSKGSAPGTWFGGEPHTTTPTPALLIKRPLTAQPGTRPLATQTGPPSRPTKQPIEQWSGDGAGCQWMWRRVIRKASADKRTITFIFQFKMINFSPDSALTETARVSCTAHQILGAGTVRVMKP